MTSANISSASIDRDSFGDGDGQARASSIVFLPAMGVAAGFYQPFLARLEAACNASAVAVDLPGQGDHPQRARRGDDFGYREVVEELIPAAIDKIAARNPGRPIVLAGHSLGGQLAVLSCAAVAAQIDRLVLIAAGTAHWRAWPARDRLRAALTVYGITAAARVLPWYPGALLGFGGDQPRRFMRDWSYNARRGRYRLEGSPRTAADLERALAAVRVPVYALAIRDDPVAPEGARDELLALLPNARITRAFASGVVSDAPWRRHFSWARRPADIESSIARWLAPQRETAAVPASA